MTHWQKADGFFNFEQFYASIADNLQRGAIAVEVGAYKGKSILYLAEALLQRGVSCDLFAVDHFKGSEEHNISAGQLLSEYLENVYPMRDHITTLIMPSEQAAQHFADGSLDFVFIDASHDYQSVVKDIRAWKPKVRKGGMLAGHDIHHQPVRDAVTAVLGNFDEYPGTVWGIEV